MLHTADIRFTGINRRLVEGEIVTLDEVDEIGRAWLVQNRYVAELTGAVQAPETAEALLAPIETRMMSA